MLLCWKGQPCLCRAEQQQVSVQQIPAAPHYLPPPPPPLQGKLSAGALVLAMTWDGQSAVLPHVVSDLMQRPSINALKVTAC